MAKTARKSFEELTGLAGCVSVCRELIVGTVGAKCYLQYLASNVHDDTCTFFKSTQDIAADTGLDEHTIRDLNKKWKEKGLITIEEHPWWTGDAHDYTLHLPTLRQTLKEQEKSGTREAKKLKKKTKAKERTKKWRAKKKALREAQVTGKVTVTA